MGASKLGRLQDYLVDPVSTRIYLSSCIFYFEVISLYRMSLNSFY